MSILERMRDRAEKTKKELDQEKEKDRKEKEHREKERRNEDAPEYQRMSVYCDTCQRDYSVMMRKHGTELLAYYLGECVHGHTVRREILLRDRYYDRSRVLREERELHSDDLLTPNDARFKLVYPEQWKEIERQREEREKLNLEKGEGV